MFSFCYICDEVADTRVEFYEGAVPVCKGHEVLMLREALYQAINKAKDLQEWQDRLIEG